MNPSLLTSTVEENSRKHERELRQAEQRLSEAHDHNLQLEHSILEGLREVSAVQLDNPDGFSRDVNTELNNRRDEEAQLRRDLQNVEVSIGSLNDMATELTGRLEVLTANVNRALAVDPSYLGLLQSMRSAVENFEAYKSQEIEIAAECSTKIGEYNRNPVFAYLLNANFGNDQYKSRFLVKALDGWLAVKIGFHSNAANYRMLLAMQEANLTRNAELKQEAEVAEEMVKTAAQRSFEAAGLSAMQSRLESVRKKINEHKRSANWFHTSLGKFALRTDDHSKKAQELILSSLRTRSFDEIQALVRQSTSASDTHAAARVAVLQRELAGHHQTLPALEQARDIAEDRYNRAKDLERAIRSGDYAGTHYRYDQNLNLDYLILGYMAGNLDLTSVEGTVQRHQLENAQADTWNTHTNIGSDDGRSGETSSGYLGGSAESFSISDSIGSSSDSVSTSDSC